MRRFVRLHPLQIGLDWIDQCAQPLGEERIGLSFANGRTLSEDILAPSDHPSGSRAKVDGFALRGMETVGASTYNSLSFTVIAGTAGRPVAGSVASGCAVRVGMGCELPEGLDAVVPGDLVEEKGAAMNIDAAVAPGENVQRRGSEVAQGAVLMRAGQRIGRFGWATLAGLGIRQVSVIRRPRVRILAIGSELVGLGVRRELRQEFDVNSGALACAVAGDGGVVEATDLIPDERGAIREGLLPPGADLILVAGATGQGLDDHAPSVLAEVGEVVLHGFALRQARSAGLGRIHATLVVLLPGYPASCLCAYELLAARVIRRMSGRSGDWPNQREATLVRKVVSRLGFAEFCPVRFVAEGVEPLTAAAAGSLSNHATADGFILIPEPCEGYPPGVRVMVNLYDR